MVWRLISNVWFSVIINGESFGFFKSTRGLRQGDSLSPALIIIGAEVLSTALNRLIEQPTYLGFKTPPGCPLVSHLAFADDVLIFANASTNSLKRLICVLEKYQADSGQQINSQKSCHLAHPKLTPVRVRVIERLTNFVKKQFPIKYLGCTLYIGKFKISYYLELCQNIRNKFYLGNLGYYHRDVGWS